MELTKIEFWREKKTNLEQKKKIFEKNKNKMILEKKKIDFLTPVSLRIPMGSLKKSANLVQPFSQL